MDGLKAVPSSGLRGPRGIVLCLAPGASTVRYEVSHTKSFSHIRFQPGRHLRHCLVQDGEVTHGVSLTELKRNSSLMARLCSSCVCWDYLKAGAIAF